MANFNPFAMTKARKGKVAGKMTKQSKGMSNLIERAKNIEEDVLGNFDQQIKEIQDTSQKQLNEIKNIVERAEQSERRISEKKQELQLEDQNVRKQISLVAQQLVEADIAGDAEQVCSLDAELTELNRESMSNNAKLRAYEDAEKVTLKIQERKKIAEVFNQYQELTVYTSEFEEYGTTLEDLMTLIRQLQAFKDQLEEKMERKAIPDEQESLKELERALGVSNFTIEKSMSKHNVSRASFDRKASSYIPEWLNCEEELSFDEFIDREIQQYSERRAQTEIDNRVRVRSEEAARQRRNDEVLERHLKETSIQVRPDRDKITWS